MELEEENRIYVGKVLKLPESKKRRRNKSYRVAKAKVSPRMVQQVSTGSYRVRKNDNLSKIAKKFKTNSMELARLNGNKKSKLTLSRPKIVDPQKGGCGQSKHLGYQ